jgi:type IV pilus assembly protein PilB
MEVQTLAIKNVPIGQVLLESHYITQEELDEALNIQKKESSKKLGTILVEKGYITESQLTKALGQRLKVQCVELAEIKIDSKTLALINETLAKKYSVIPIEVNGKTLTVATSDPMNFYALDDLRLSTNMEIKTVLASPGDIKRAIDRFYTKKQAEEAAEDVSREFRIDSIGENFGMVDEKIDNAPVVRLVNSMIDQAVKLGASDIHIEPMDNETRVRVRVDGVLQNQMTLNKGAHSAVITRLKIMSGMNIAERRLPQDGRVETVIDGKPIDLRLSILPTVDGEKMVIRILGGMGMLFTRNQLGLNNHNEVLFDRIIKNPNGIILVSGPTGSGKTTTLYAILREFNNPGVNIITVEDPVEYRIAGINQVQVNNKAGLTFASGLRSILRQDPDIIMIGEIRDSETAEIAVRAAITGHLVLSTIHTNDAPSTVVRLVDMGIEPYLVSSSVVGVIAQRLVRNICSRCKTVYEPTSNEAEMLGLKEGQKLWRGNGCAFCGGTGYKGRTAIHEIMVIDKTMRDLISKGAPTDELRSYAIKNGMLTLSQSCADLVKSGVTTLEEMIKTTYNL